MTITSEMRNEQYERSPEHIQNLYRSNGVWLKQILTAFRLPEEHYSEFALSIGDAILGLIPLNKLIPLLMMQLDIDHPTAERINESFIQFLAHGETEGVFMPSLSQAEPSVLNSIPTSLGEVPDADSAIRDELLLKPRMTEKIVDRTIPEPGTKPLTREEILRSLAAKRTLQSDVSALQQNPPQQ